MQRFIFALVIMLSFSGCTALSASDEALLREIRVDLIQSTRPTLVEALRVARPHDGMIDPLRTERVLTVDAMISAIDRVYPPADVDGDGAPDLWAPEPLPWAPMPGEEDE